MDIDIYPNQQAQWDFLTDFSSYWCLYQGGWGCLAGDTLIETIDGPRRIDSIKAPTVYKAWNGFKYIWTKGSAPHLKGRDYLYRVTHKRGEFVAAGHHRCAFSSNEYLPLEQVFARFSEGEAFEFLHRSNREHDQLARVSNALHSMKLVVDSLIYYLSGNHSCDVLLHEVPDSDLKPAPLLNDALLSFLYDAFYLFHEHKDALLELIPKHNLTRPHTSHSYMSDSELLCDLFDSHRDMVAYLEQHICELSHTANREIELLEKDYTLPWLAPLMICLKKLQQLLAHVKSTSDSPILNIEKLSIKEDYWDVNIPNHHNYLTSDGAIHHNSGKTYIAARKTLLLTLQNKYPSMAVAPTWSDMGRYLIPELVKACEEYQIPYQVKTAARPPTFEVYGIPIYLFTGDKIARITGVEVGVAWIDEGARIRWKPDNPTEDIVIQVQGRLRSKDSNIIHQINISTTPEGMDTWVNELCFNTDSDLYKANKHRTKAYIGQTKKNKALQKEYLAGLEGSLSEELTKQYLDGIAVNYIANRAHPRFNKDNIIKPIPLDLGKEYHVSMDFNVSPCCWELSFVNHKEQTITFVDELIVEDNATIETMIHKAHQKGWTKLKCEWHPDRSGNNRSLVGDPQIAVAEKAAQQLGWNYKLHKVGKNPPVNTRINLVDMMVENAKQEKKLFVTQNCKKIIEEMYNTGRLKNGYDPGPQNKRGHINDGIGYVIFDVFHNAHTDTFKTIRIGHGL